MTDDDISKCETYSHWWITFSPIFIIDSIILFISSHFHLPLYTMLSSSLVQPHAMYHQW